MTKLDGWRYAVKRFALLLIILFLVVIPIVTTVTASLVDSSDSMILLADNAEEPVPENFESDPGIPMNDPGEKPDIMTTINNFLSLVARMLPWLLVLTVVFLALWVFFDADRRTDYGWVWGIASLLVLPWILYLLWRPILTSEERVILESDIKLRKIESDYYQYVLSKEKHICPVCGTPISDDYQVCPNCFKQLKMVCPNCNRLLEVDWKVCPFCTTRVRKQEE
ncbi:MAG: zinc ribbon domain-containing protein [Caldisericia bacterium]|nr:zinc ribbon domain-containing protein [Caldisericia bacterium]